NPPALPSLSDLSPLQLALTAATNLRQSDRALPRTGCPLWENVAKIQFSQWQTAGDLLLSR
ncbi:hypothetical protein, partial [uncultured Roseobacter sp.]|uniref:hypothetical protein n=1 Tax=uncultured Roseobacter sp. TaxID=114847 RepID=UPI00261C8F91